METVLLIVHVLIAIAVIGLVLMQQGKGADAGASFGGGASQTVFGSAGSAGFMVKLTGGLAALFFVTSLALAVIAKNKAVSAGTVGLPSIEMPAGSTPAADSTAPKTVD